VIRPKILLLDEPLANLDAHLRDEMRDLILNIHKTFEVTTVFVTHDQEEAVLLADRIALIFDGKLVQYSPSKDFYEKPASERIARFFGNGNILHGTKSGSAVSTPFGGCAVRPNLEVPDGDVSMFIRPESIKLGQAGVNSFLFRIRKKIYMGTYTRYTIESGGIEFDATGDSHDIAGYEQGSDAWFAFPPEKLWLIPQHAAASLPKAGSCSEKA